MLVPWAVISGFGKNMGGCYSRPDGLFNMVLNRLDLVMKLSFLSSPALQMPTLIAVDVWKTTPLWLFYFAGLQLTPGALRPER